ncbi:hypothetical protein E2562_024104 [Oryza meyeriana var. granulata]|uniref:Uncharacterized protein n=1 Tax=Oryza meyeriana var. granulata TaxID=110450 RepID=A0A6G1CID2_9ORYZ|nr:hypothetical protein E2562_024104 [Oryza meyeriana var. granulata]
MAIQITHSSAARGPLIVGWKLQRSASAARSATQLKVVETINSVLSSLGNRSGPHRSSRSNVEFNNGI